MFNTALTYVTEFQRQANNLPARFKRPEHVIWMVKSTHTATEPIARQTRRCSKEPLVHSL